MFKSPSPRAISLSTSQPSSQVPSTILPLFEAIEIQKQNSSSHPHITESRAQQITMSEPIQSAILQTVEEVIPVEFYETLGGSSSGAATTIVEHIGDQLDSGYIIKTPLKATADKVTTVISASVGSPKNQEKWAFVSNDTESSPIIKTNTTTTGGYSDDPIKVGDELSYKDLTVRVSTIEIGVAEMKELMKQMIELFKSQPTTQQIANELWNSTQPILQAQRNLAESNHNFSLEFIRNMVDARYKDTQANVINIKEHLFKLTSSTPTSIFEKDDDDAKKGEKDSLRKLPPDSKAKSKPMVQQQLESAEQKSSAKASEAGKEKGIDEILNHKGEEIVLEKLKKQDTKESTANPTEIVSSAEPKSKPSPKKPQQNMEKIASTPSSPILSIDADIRKVSADVSQTAAETPVVLAEVFQTSSKLIFTTPTTLQAHPTAERLPTHSL
ncbi:hypothetical protein Hanom_Chr10g00891571 [Helianthus anomalus]